MLKYEMKSNKSKSDLVLKDHDRSRKSNQGSLKSSMNGSLNDVLRGEWEKLNRKNSMQSALRGVEEGEAAEESLDESASPQAL